MPFVYDEWKNLPNKTTPIDASRLNAMCAYIAKLSARSNTFVDVTEGSGSGGGAIYRVGFTCQMNLTLSGVSLVQPLFTMPDGFKPSMNFDTPLFSIETGAEVGVISYDRPTDSLMFIGTTTPLPSICKATICYICDEPI
jgi:hypothetical protein